MQRSPTHTTDGNLPLTLTKIADKVEIDTEMDRCMAPLVNSHSLGSHIIFIIA